MVSNLAGTVLALSHLLLLVKLLPGGVLHLLTDPVALLRVRDVHVLNAQGAAICLFELRDDLAEGDLGPGREILEVALHATRGAALEDELWGALGGGVDKT